MMTHHHVSWVITLQQHLHHQQKLIQPGPSIDLVSSAKSFGKTVIAWTVSKRIRSLFIFSNVFLNDIQVIWQMCNLSSRHSFRKTHTVPRWQIRRFPKLYSVTIETECHSCVHDFQGESVKLEPLYCDRVRRYHSHLIIVPIYFLIYHEFIL